MARQAVAATELDLDLDAELRGGRIDMAEVAAWLDGQTPTARLAAVRSLTGMAQARLYEAAKGHRKRKLEDLVPAEVEPLREVVHEGKNSLPVFTTFAKVFCRPKGELQEAWGYNRSGPLVERAVGPGYFVAYEGPGDELLIDYTRLPKTKPSGWPEIIPNHERLSRFVYSGMIDALRAVSTHVSIGRAIKNGKVQDNWFVLTRTD
jgi:hypothetical protein